MSTLDRAEASPYGRFMTNLRAILVVFAMLVGLLASASPAAAQAEAEWRANPDVLWDVTNPDLTSRHIGQVRALVRDMQEHNGQMYVAGKFLDVKAPDGTTYDQPYLAAFDLETGEWNSSFRPAVGGIVIAIEITPDGRLYASGEMPGGIELFDAATGAKNPTFDPQIANWWGPPAVYDIELVGNDIYLGGTFSSSQGTALSNLAKVDATTGTLDTTWVPTAQFDFVTPRIGGSLVYGLAVDEARGRVYLAGKFGGINENTDASYFATLNTSDGELTAGLPQGLPAGIPNHRTSFSMWMMDVQFSGNEVYVGGQGHQTMVLAADDLAISSTFFTNRGVGDVYAGGDTQVIFVGKDTVWSGCHCWGSVGEFELGSYISAADGVMVYEEYVQWVRDFRDINPFGQQPAGGGFGIDIATETLVPLSFEVTGQAGAYAIVEDSNGRVWFGGQYLSDSVTGRQVEGIVRFSRTDEVVPPVAAPTDFVSTIQTRERVVLRWDAVPGTTSYEVTQDGVTLTPSTSRWFTARDLTAGTSYDFTVQAVFADGSRSAVTEPLTVATDGFELDAPTGFVSTLQTRERAVMTWNGVLGAAEYEITQDGAVVATQSSRWFTARDLTPGTTYDFTVEAVFANGTRTAPTTPLSVTTDGIAADTPTGFISTFQSRERVVLNWSNMGSGVTYEIRQDGILVGTQTSRWFTARNLDAGTAYAFTVQAIYPNGEVSDETSPLSVSTQP